MIVKNIAFIGSGKTLLDCVRVVTSFNSQNNSTQFNLSAIINDSKNQKFNNNFFNEYEKTGSLFFNSDNINSHEILEALKRCDIDFIFSVNNFQIIKQDLINLPKKGFINFHNGPLPKYGGINACTWAIFNQEQFHGVTWHFVDAGVDTGDIIIQKIFPIVKSDTAIVLTMKCIKEGIELFKELLPKLFSETLAKTPQDLGQRTYYKKTDYPNHGHINFGWDFEKLDCFMRSLTFAPFPNLCTFPSASLNGQVFYLDKIEFVESIAHTITGKIEKIIGDDIFVSTKDRLIKLKQLRDQDKNPIDNFSFIEKYQLKEGLFLNK